MNGPLNRLRFSLDHRWTPSRASAYIDDELSMGDRRRVARHTADCPECRELLRELSTLVGTLAQMRDDEGVLMATTILASVRGRLQDDPQSGW